MPSRRPPRPPRRFGRGETVPRAETQADSRADPRLGRGPQSRQRTVAEHGIGRGRWSTRRELCNINAALRLGLRGLPSGLSLRRLLGHLPASRRPRLTVDQVLAWGEAHHAATGQWPNSTLRMIVGTPDEKWGNVNECLRFGLRGLPSGLSLAKLFPGRKRNLTQEQILAWAEAHKAATGRWPTTASGAVDGAPGETCATSMCPSAWVVAASLPASLCATFRPFPCRTQTRADCRPSARLGRGAPCGNRSVADPCFRHNPRCTR